MHPSAGSVGGIVTTGTRRSTGAPRNQPERSRSRWVPAALYTATPLVDTLDTTRLATVCPLRSWLRVDVPGRVVSAAQIV